MNKHGSVTFWLQAACLLVFISYECHSLPITVELEDSTLNKLRQAHTLLGEAIDDLINSKQETKKSMVEQAETSAWQNRQEDLEGLEEELDKRDDGPEPKSIDDDLSIQDPQPEPADSKIDDADDELEETVLRRLALLLEKRREALMLSKNKEILSHSAHKRDHDIPFPFFGDNNDY